MANNLPFELLSQIAAYLHADDYPLAAYTVVCRHWQTAFESFIYSNLTVYSEAVEDPEAYKDKAEVHSKLREIWNTATFKYPSKPAWSRDDQDAKKSRKPLSLSLFITLTSGANAARRAWIRHLKYKVVVPFLIEDWKAIKGQHYNYKNPIREENDKAFQSGVIGLFEILKTWSQTHRLSLELGLFGREVCGEPDTNGQSHAGDYDWDYTNGRTTAVQPYRARFLDDSLKFPSALCVDRLLFLNGADREGGNRNHRIWASTIFEIVVHCPTLTELDLDLDEYIRPDHEGLIKQRRQDVAEGLKRLPDTLRVFRYKNQTELNWKETMPALNVLPPSGTDALSINLQALSFRLRELKVEQTTLSLDFLCPLDSDLKPISDLSSLYWPHLEILNFELVPRFTPSGEWLFHYTAELQAEVAAIDDWNAEICDLERGWSYRELINYDDFHRLFVSMGYAAQRMPHLAQINFVGDFESESTFHFVYDSSTAVFTATWESYSEYQPNDQVASAWGFRLEDMEDDEMSRDYGAITSTVRFPMWPPHR
ncbi:hypothetical protein DTO207G8_1113 [Paecilomyces variotii]|nr:hypothetical protein DTO169C6_5688 [Paecilomyces variotii]KAJ9258953.1 hypothetical protein DTO207G8_1113 [Paecilomyces variotii]